MPRIHTSFCLAVLMLLTPAVAFAAPHEPMRNHITLGFGVARHVSDDFEDTGHETGGVGQLSYRYSLNPGWDLCLDTRSTMTSDEVFDDDLGGDIEFEHSASFFGPGARWSSGQGSVRPYLQANVFFVTETTRIEFGGLSSEVDDDGVGFGLMGGADIRLSRLLSLPLEASYLNGKPENDVSSLGMSVGLTFNFTPLP